MPRIAIFAALAAAVAAMPAAASAQAGPDPERMAEQLRAADTNHDGTISRAEFLAYRANQWSRMDRNRDGYFSRNDLLAFLASRWDSDRLREMRATFDTNHDGRISRAEFVNGPTIAFAMADSNHDGLVTQPELRALAARRKG